MNNRIDVAVVGGGILGLAHAWRAAARGMRVAVFERSPQAQGASIRNFGMIWPIGQPHGEHYEIAMRSRELWLELGNHGVLPVQSCGSLHLAHHPDELSVLEEFCQQGTHQSEMKSPSEVMNLAPLVNDQGLRGGMFSPTELRVDPRIASQSIAAFLQRQYQAQVFFNSQVVAVSPGRLKTADGVEFEADRIVICSGSDLRTLYPDAFAASGLIACKLQMLKVTAQHEDLTHCPHIASGLTLRHYHSFQHCPSLAAVQSRFAATAPRLDEFGIHVMASVNANNEIIIGDSHEYGDAITPFDKSEINELILRELKKILRLQNWAIIERWHGIYTKLPGPSRVST